MNNNSYLIHPYAVGRDKKSLAMVLPSQIVKSLGINPQSVFLLLKVKSADILQIQIIQESDLAKKEEYDDISVDKVSQSSQQGYGY